MPRADGDEQQAPAPSGTPSKDAFQAFVNVLAAHLDTPGTTPEELAAQTHLSRFHLDHVVKAVSGESPGSFRRRVLLERAAYRMLTSDRTLLDVAVEAGYGSHEAFTRAFRRAYGVSPSHWRDHPTNIQIDAPSGVHFHPPAGLRLPGRRPTDALDLVSSMVEHHVWLVTELARRATRLDDTKLDAPVAGAVDGIDGASLRWLISRLIGQLEMWSCAVEDREYDFAVERNESPASMVSRIGRVGPRFVRQVSSLSAEGRLDETFVEAFSETPVVHTYGAMVAHVLTFGGHHRLLAVVAMSTYGIDDLGYGDPKWWWRLRPADLDNRDQGRPGGTPHDGPDA